MHKKFWPCKTGSNIGVLVRHVTYKKKFLSELPYSKNTDSSKKDPKIAVSGNFEHFLHIENASHEASTAFLALLIILSDKLKEISS